jgi:agmatine deiminase
VACYFMHIKLSLTAFLDNQYSIIALNSLPAYNEYHPKFQEELYNSLIKEGLEIQKLIYWPDENSENAMGLYMNFLEIGNFILMPTFGEFGSTFNKVWEADEIAAIQLEEAYQKPDLKIIDSRHIAYDGGALNCISWKISIEV